MKAQFPEKLAFLFRPMRYKIAYGGRCGLKSWSFARALLLLGVSRPVRVLCAREVQNSIKDSVHKLLSDQIAILGLGSKYRIMETEIRGTNGTSFAFTGLSSMTVESIKSFEGCDFCWVEEAQSISDRSWTILIPTIRKDDSEIWISFNPELETDPTYQRFIANKRDDAISVKTSYKDNPWFNAVMEAERLHCLKTDPEGYKNIWDGDCKPAVTGAIYYKEIQQAQSQNRVCNVPYDPMLKVHLVLELGWGDSLAISFVQKNLSEIRIINYLEYSQTSLDIVSSDIRNHRYNWGKVWLPHDGFNKTLNAGGKSTEDIMKALGWDVAKKEEISILSVEDGIRNARIMFSRCYFDKNQTDANHDPFVTDGQTVLTHRLVECLKRYRRKINKETDTATTPVHDEFSHGADNFRYICANADKMFNEEVRRQRVYHVGYSPLDPTVGY